MKKTLPPKKMNNRYIGFGRLIPTWMFRAVLVTLLILGFTPHTVFGQPKKLFSLGIRDAYLTELFLQIEKQSDYSFVYQTEDIEALGKKNFTCIRSDLESILQRCFSGTNLVWEISDNHIIIRQKSTQPRSERVTVEGRVLDEYRKPLAGVSVLVKGTRYGTTTDSKGEFKFAVPRREKMVIRFTFIGMTPQELDYVEGKRLFVNMQQSSTDIGNVEVVHTGYQELTPREMAASIVSIKAEDIYNPGLATIDQMLEGNVPGLTFMQSSGQLGATPKLRIRGTTTILGSQEPLWVIDGVVQTDPVNIDPEQLNDLDFVNLLGNAVSGLNPEDIDQIDILKDASATALYGKSASNGVIVVTTKRGKVGPPVVTYSFSGSFTQRPRYTDRSVDVMNSLERTAFSRELMNNRQVYPTITSWLGYESIYRDYLNGEIDYNEFSCQAGYYETLNTDWFDLLMQNGWSNRHTLSLSGGTTNVRYHASLGMNNQQGSIQGEKSKTYTANFNLTGNYRRFKVQFGMNGSVTDTDGEPTDLNINDYAYNTSRAVPAYNEDGGYWSYLRGSSVTSNEGDTYPFNILEDMENSYRQQKSNNLTVRAGVDYDITSTLKITTLLSYTASNSYSGNYHGANTWYGRTLNMGYRKSGETYYRETLMPVGGELKESRTDKRGYSARAALVYTEKYGKQAQHKVDASLGTEISSTVYNGFNQTYRGYDPEHGNIMLGVDLMGDNSVSENKNMPYEEYANWLQTAEAMGIRTINRSNNVAAYMTLGYGYKEHAYFSFNMRSDFSNEFGSRANERFLPAWAVAGRWNITENVLKDVKWINSLSLRASFGSQGNVPSVPTRLVIKTPSKNNGWDSQWQAFVKEVYKWPNPDLRWEKTYTTNIGLDFAILKRKITGTIEWYYRKTTDAYMSQTVSEVNGVNSYTVNRGTITNQGLDFTLNFTPINRLTEVNGEIKGFRWRFDPSFGSVINQLIDKLVQTPETTLKHDNEIYYNEYLDGTIHVVGRPINGFYSYQFAGLDGKDGRPMFKNFEETVSVTDPQTGEVTEMSRAEWLQNYFSTNQQRYMTVMTYSGTRVPTVQGSLRNTFTYNNFTLSVNLTYSLGSKIRLTKLYPNVSKSNGTIAPLPTENVRRELLYRWQKPGDELHTNIPGIIPSSEFAATLDPWWQKDRTFTKLFNDGFAPNIWQMYDYSDVRVVSGNYLKIASISFRYQLPKKFCNRIRMKSGYLMLTGTNLYTFASSKLKGQDPTTSGGSAIAISIRPTYSLSLNVSF